MTGERLAEKILLVGWGGADWSLIRPLLEAGELPNLKGVIQRGATGNLATLSPPVLPLLWTSLATGKRPQKHALLGFLEPDPGGPEGVRPAGSRSRQAKAVWNLLTHCGLRSSVVAWPATHPAEPIRGIVVSDLYARRGGDGANAWRLRPGTIHPSRLADDLTELRIHPSELSAAQLRPFVPAVEHWPEGERDPLAALAAAVAWNASVHAAATWLLEREPWDFFAVYYNLTDHLCHRFLEFQSPRMEHVSEERFELYRGVVSEAYRFQDKMLGRLLELTSDDVTLLVVSEHGFQSGHARREADRIASWLRSYGVICMRGPGIRRDAHVYGASLLDVAPTLLRLFGLPVANDMDGRPLLQAFESSVGFESIRSFEGLGGDFGTHDEDGPHGDAWEVRASLELLPELGQIEGRRERRQRNAAEAERERHLNLARAYLDSRVPDQAVPLLEALWEAEPKRLDAALDLARALQQAGDLARCREVVEAISRVAPHHPGAQMLRGTLLAAEDRPEAALDQLFRAAAAAPGLPGVHERIGLTYLMLRRWKQAEHAFKRALDLDGDSAQAHYGLSITYLRQRRPEEAVEQALRAVGLQHFFPQAHFQLGVALARTGHQRRAVQAFETCLSMRPQTPEAHRWLGVIHERAFGDRDKAAAHRRRLDSLLRSAAASAS